MQYKSEIKINAPIETVANLLSDPAERKKWIKEIDSYKLLSGKPSTVNAKTLLTALIGGRKLQITETIRAINFPKHFSVLYEMNEGSLLANSDLTQMDDGSTLYILTQTFEFKGPLKLATVFMKPAFKKHSDKMMHDLKKVAEK